jgi:hypothetical protein
MEPLFAWAQGILWAQWHYQIHIISLKLIYSDTIG